MDLELEPLVLVPDSELEDLSFGVVEVLVVSKRVPACGTVGPSSAAEGAKLFDIDHAHPCEQPESCSRRAGSGPRASSLGAPEASGGSACRTRLGQRRRWGRDGEPGPQPWPSARASRVELSDEEDDGWSSSSVPRPGQRGSLQPILAGMSGTRTTVILLIS